MSRRTQDNRRGRSGRGGQNNVQPVTIAAPSGSEMVGVATGGVTRLGNAAADANVSGRTTQLGGILDLISSQGAYALNPQQRSAYDATVRSVGQATRGPLAQISRIETQVTNAQATVDYLTQKQETGTLTRAEQNQLSRAQSQVTRLTGQQERLQGRVDLQNQRLTDFEADVSANAPTATDMLREAFPELQQTLDNASPYLDRMGQLGSAGEQLMSTLGQGYQAGSVGARDARAVRAQQVADVGGGMLGQSLMDEARRRIGLQGQLSPEAARDAVQSARQAFSARGLGTSGGAIGAELLNRDRYSRQRAFEDLGFATGVQGQDLERQFQNQRTQLGISLADQQAGMQSELSNQDAALRASVANEEARRLGNQMNVGMLGQAFTTQQMLNQEGVNASLTRGQLASGANPLNMMINWYGQGNPTGSEALPSATSMANTWATNTLNAASHNANATMWADAANRPMPSMQSGNGAAWGGVGGMALGAGIGALLAAPTGGMSIPMGMAIGGGLGGGVGSAVGGLIAR